MSDDYKEALEKAKDWMACSSCTDKERTLLKSLFKELNENPEDNIRKTLIKELEISAQFRRHVQEIGLSPDKVISWLKDQEGSVGYDELTCEDINELEEIINQVHYEFRASIGRESFGREVLDRFLESKDIETSKKSDKLMKALQTANAKIGELVEENYHLKNPEWSEEDENNRLLINKAIWEFVGENGITQGQAGGLIQWLKSKL